MVDVGFEILIPTNCEPLELTFNQPFFDWGGMQHPKGQPEASFHYFKLTKSPVPNHVRSALPPSFQQMEWQCISIQGIEETSRRLKNELNASDLHDLLDTVLKGISFWVVLFEPGYDRIDERLSGDLKLVYEKIISSLTQSKNGFIVWNGG